MTNETEIGWLKRQIAGWDNAICVWRMDGTGKWTCDENFPKKEKERLQQRLQLLETQCELSQHQQLQ